VSNLLSLDVISLLIDFLVIAPLETPEALEACTNLGAFRDYDKLPDEALNAVQNFLRAECLSVAHQIHFLDSHYRGAYERLVRVITAKLARSDIEDIGRACDDPALVGLIPAGPKGGPAVTIEAPVASGSGQK
jgi:hypothetical protein